MSKRKKYFLIIIAVLLVVAIGATTFIIINNSKPKNSNVIGNEPSSRFYDLEFSEFYKQSQTFPELEPLFRKYFAYIDIALKKSNKKDMDTFNLPEDFYNVQSEIEELFDKYEAIQDRGPADKNSEESRRAFLEEWWSVYTKFRHPYLSMSIHILEWEAFEVFMENTVEVGDPSSAEEEAWLKETEEILNYAYEGFKDETTVFAERE